MSATGRYHAFVGYGIELEYMIVDKATLEVAPISDHVLREADGTIVNELSFAKTCWSNELVKHVIELKTNGPASITRDLVKQFQADLQQINQRLESKNAAIMPSAMHPLFDPSRGVKLWEHDDATIYETYNRIFDCRGHGWSNLQSMHINLPFYDDSEFERLHAAVRVVLPLLPGLAAASPIYEGKVTGLSDNRLEFYRHNQKKVPSIAGSVIPEPAWSEADYHELIYKKIQAEIIPHDTDNVLEVEWLNSRGAIARFDRNAIEIRVIDVQESPRMDLAIAALVTSLVRGLYDENLAPLAEQKKLLEQELLKTFLETLKGGSDATIRDRDLLAVVGAKEGSAQSLWKDLYTKLLALYPEALNPFAEEYKVLLEQGCLSKRITKKLGANPSVEMIRKEYQELCNCVALGLIYT